MYRGFSSATGASWPTGRAALPRSRRWSAGGWRAVRPLLRPVGRRRNQIGLALAGVWSPSPSGRSPPACRLLVAGALSCSSSWQGAGAHPGHINELRPTRYGLPARLRLPMRRGGCQSDSAHPGRCSPRTRATAQAMRSAARCSSSAPWWRGWARARGVAFGACLHTLRQHDDVRESPPGISAGPAHAARGATTTHPRSG